MKSSDICVLIPTRKRPKQLERVLTSLVTTAPWIHWTVIIDADDTDSLPVCQNIKGYEQYGAVCILSDAKQGCVKAWNAGFAFTPNFAAYIIGADDLVFMPGWLEATLIGLEQLGGSGLVGFNDGRKDGNLFTATHYLMTRDFIIQYHGGVAVIPAYTGEMTDLEANERARKVNKFYWARSARVYHDWRGGPMGDETSRLAWERRAENQRIYAERKAAGFPDDFDPILKDAPAVEKKGKARRGKNRQ